AVGRRVVFVQSGRGQTRLVRAWSSEVCSSDLAAGSSPARLRSGLPGGCSGNGSASTPTAPSSAAVRQATRAPLERPPTISGVFEVGRAACRGRGGSGAVGPPRAKRSDARGGEA